MVRCYNRNLSYPCVRFLFLLYMSEVTFLRQLIATSFDIINRFHQIYLS